MGAAGASFPFFSAEFLEPGCDSDQIRDETRSRAPEAPATSTDMKRGPQDAVTRPSVLKRLQLDNIDAHSLDSAGPTTEVRSRKEKLKACSKEASRIAAGLFVGGDVVAKDKGILQATKISHVINCVGQLYEPYFEDRGIVYLTLYLNDSPKEDILSILYDSFEFIDDARNNDGNVFVHCSQGVSRSMSLAIAYRMWKEAKSYEEVFADAKMLRSVANPNIGFVFQLMQWWKRRRESSSGKGSPNLYRIAPQSAMNPRYLVPRWLNSGLDAKYGVDPCLDPRGAFVVHRGDVAYVWKGSEILSEAFVDAARRFVMLLKRFELDHGMDIEIEYVEQGSEDHTFTSLVETCLPSAKVEHCPAFDADFDIWTSAQAQNPSGSSRSRKTPRRKSIESGDSKGSSS